LIGNDVEATELKEVLSKQKHINQSIYDLAQILAR